MTNNETGDIESSVNSMSEDGDTRCNVCASVWSAFAKTNRASSSTNVSRYRALIRANSERSASKKRFSDRRCSSSSIATTGATNESKNDWTNLITRAVSCDTPAVRSSCGPSAAVAAATALDTSVDRRFCVIFLHSRIPRDVRSQRCSRCCSRRCSRSCSRRCSRRCS